MQRAYYANTLAAFTSDKPKDVLATLSVQSVKAGLPPLQSQLNAWEYEIRLLQAALTGYQGSIYLEYSIPRMGRRADVVLLIGKVVFLIEFKVGEKTFSRSAEDQVWDYALDLKNFHETSHHEYIVPVLLATDAKRPKSARGIAFHHDKTCSPLRATPGTLSSVLDEVLQTVGPGLINSTQWEAGRYRPTPTIIEAAWALYSRHSVADISRNDAGAINLARTSKTIAQIIAQSKEQSRKSICFVTGVPGAGKTLVGLNTATQFMQRTDDLFAVFLSGNGPLVKILCEALARDEVFRAKELGHRIPLSEARSKVKSFIQNIHHFRDECLINPDPPAEHVAIFDEAQRAWNFKQTCDFMRRKKKRPGFNQSEPEYLISCMDRHPDWAVIVCLVGAGQEINIGEAGIGEWIASLNRSFPHWDVYLSERLTDSEYDVDVSQLRRVELRDDLHLSTSMRSFRAENVSAFVKQLLDIHIDKAKDTLRAVLRSYPIFLTRKLELAKRWLRKQARGSERFGIVVSSQAKRLRPHAIDVRSPVDPVHWFLDGKEDVRSSYYLEDVATEFHVQGLELDWTCVAWDADFRFSGERWDHWSFRGSKWKRIHSPERQRYLKNAYRVLLTRARQGMIIVVPDGDPEDPTRAPDYYDGTYSYLKKVGIPEIS